MTRLANPIRLTQYRVDTEVSIRDPQRVLRISQPTSDQLLIHLAGDGKVWHSGGK